MSHVIQCEVCGSVVGHIHKEMISEDDRVLYRETVTCPNGHTGSVEISES